MALHAARSCSRRVLLPRQLAPAASRSIRSSLFATSSRLRQNAFHSQLHGGPADAFSEPATKIVNPQTMVEKIVQKYSVGLAPGKKVRSGDYVTM